METASDIDTFFSDFADDVIWMPQSGEPVTVKALFDSGDAVGNLFNPITAVQLRLRLPVHAAPDLKKGDTFSIDGVTYAADAVRYSRPGRKLFDIDLTITQP